MNKMNLVDVDKNSISDTMEQQGTPAQLIFFRQLHSMISNETRSGVVVWLPDGLGFAILSKQAFTDNILGRYFGRSKFASFTRRLKRWGFVRQGKSYYHSEFNRDMEFENDFDNNDDFGKKGHHPRPIVDAGIPFRSKGPLKKRFKHKLPPPDIPPSDIRIMPELLRVINKKKRNERNELPLPPESANVLKDTEEFMVSRALASLELQVRMKSSPIVGYEASYQIPYLVKPKVFSFSKAA
mmetsp:Transcript_13781/g.19593  ORF Transcript_13781/g.19593 Transcript_13781/m.19593 type:complete len:240 (-) Transcript_13781:77-796(-)